MMIQKFQTTFRSRNVTNLFVISVVWLFVSACVFSTSKESEKVESKPVSNSTTNISENSSNAKFNSEKNNKKEDKGDFVVQHVDVKNPRFDELDQKIKNEKLLEKAADDLNRALSLPNDIYLRSKDCGEPNAEFDPKDQSITVCYELMDKVRGCR
jgi:Putative metallopeptidase